jgi:hypothetical protein
MKEKSIILLLIVFMTISCLERNAEGNFKEYVPQVYDGNKCIEMPEMMTEKHQKNIIFVLNHYNEIWKLENGNLFVSNKIDDEILWNYTTKAEDLIWMSEAIK